MTLPSAVRRLPLVALLSLFAVPLAAQQREGDDAWAHGRYPDARAAYERVLATDPAAFRANLRLGLMLSWDGKLDSALVHVRRARIAEPGDREAQLIEARLTAWSGRLAEAERIYRDLLTREPRYVDALVGLGYVYHWQAREGPAMHRAQTALAIDSANADARTLYRAVHGNIRSAVETSANWSNDSDHNTVFWQTLGASAPLAEGVRVFGSVDALEARDPARDATRLGGEAGLSWAFGQFQLTGAAGARRLTPETATPYTNATYRARASYRPVPPVGFSASYTRTSFDEIASLIERDLDLDILDAGFDATVARGLGIYGSGSEVWFSDGNRRSSAQAGARQTIRRRFFLGAFGRVLAYERPGAGYFSPGQFVVLEGQGGYTLDSGAWDGRLSGGLGTQRIGARGAAQSEWHLEARLGRRWGTGNRIEAFGLVTNSAVSSTSGAFRYRSAGVLVRLGV